jgi:hypothetical protein
MPSFRARLKNAHLIPAKIKALRAKGLAQVMEIVSNPELILLYMRAIENTVYAHPGHKKYKRTGAMKNPAAFRIERGANGSTVYLDDQKVAEINMAESGNEDVKPYAWRWANKGKRGGFLDPAKRAIFIFLLSNLQSNPMFRVHFGNNYQMKQGPSRKPS